MDNQTPLLEKLITVSAVEVLTWGVKLKDAQSLIYNVSQNKKDGSPTVAFKTLAELPNNGIGMSIVVKYAEVEGNHNGKEYTSRYVRIIDPSGVLSPNANQPVNTPKASPQATQTPKKGDTDWDSISRGKCKTLFMVEVFKKSFEKAVNLDDYEKMAEDYADRCMRDTKKSETQNKLANSGWGGEQPAPAEPLPTIEQEPPVQLPQDDINVEDIPF